MLLSSTSGHVNSTRWLAGLRCSNAQLYGLCRDLSPAVIEISRFAATLKVDEFRAVDVACDEVYKEGTPSLLFRLLFNSLVPMSMPGIDSLDEGWWVVSFSGSNSMASTQ